jgi:phage tail sheath protein FI
MRTKGVKTMPQYLSPGVYVEEVSSGAAPIAGVGTSTAGFIGQVGDEARMPPLPGKDPDPDYKRPQDHYPVAPAGEPQIITTWGAFKNLFGDGIQEGNKTLAHAVYGFFNNGGTRCWVIRLAKPAKTTTVAPPAFDAKAIEQALAKFEAIDEIALVAVPGQTDKDVQAKVIAHCQNMKDRFAILDGKPGDKLTAGEINPGGTSNYAALYFPWVDVGEVDKDKKPIYFPPSGHIAGIYARVDGERGVHKAPANEVIRGALGVEKRLSKADQDGLNPDGINIIRQFNGNVTVWGARTLGGDGNGEWKYINVRRLFLFLRESIDKGTQWVVFEPNTPALWAKITRNVTAFLTNVWHAGALFGDTPEQAFYVKCDAETNPPEVRDLGQVVTEVGVAVVKPAEFVIFRVSQWAGPGG